jgi:heme-degrading monooxygenase HmoA
MIEIVWEFVVKEGARGQFELAFGPGGAWSKLFASCLGFRGTTLLRGAKNPRRYLVIELWDTDAQREQILTDRKAEYSALDSAFGDWTESRTEVGIFRVLAEATVYSRGRAKQSSRGPSKEPPSGLV